MGTKRSETSEHVLLDQLKEYTASGLYPMHMPGHKRNMKGDSGLPMDIDMTEVPGVDDLHDAEEILKDAMDRTARLYGAKRTWYLVNGSTCGILSAIRATVPFGGKMIVARNCHRSVWHAIELTAAQVTWVWPKIDQATGLCGGISPAEFERLFEVQDDIASVVITSPTYEGVVSDVRSIAEICHEHGAALIVDEAHGAHLDPVSHGVFPSGAVGEGADIVIQSPHKTLGSMTQTAWMHLCSDRVSENQIERQLAVFETSSPSYPLMASLDYASGMLAVRGQELMSAWAERVDAFLADVSGLKKLRILCGPNDKDVHGEFFAFDKSKIVILTEGLMTGSQMAGVLRSRYNIETEMSFPGGVLAMTGIGDGQQGVDALAKALLEIDDELVSAKEAGKAVSSSALSYGQPRVRCSIFEAVNAAQEEVEQDAAENCICAEYLYCYPPGIPLLAPGEVIGRETIEQMKRIREKGIRVRKSLSAGEKTVLTAKL